MNTLYIQNLKKKLFNFKIDINKKNLNFMDALNTKIGYSKYLRIIHTRTYTWANGVTSEKPKGGINTTVIIIVQP